MRFFLAWNSFLICVNNWQSLWQQFQIDFLKKLSYQASVLVRAHSYSILYKSLVDEDQAKGGWQVIGRESKRLQLKQVFSLINFLVLSPSLSSKAHVYSPFLEINCFPKIFSVRLNARHEKCGILSPEICPNRIKSLPPDSHKNVAPLKTSININMRIFILRKFYHLKRTLSAQRYENKSSKRTCDSKLKAHDECFKQSFFVESFRVLFDMPHLQWWLWHTILSRYACQLPTWKLLLTFMLNKRNHSSTNHEMLLDLASNLNETKKKTIYYDLDK